MTRILMVDDSEIACVLMRAQLKPFGYDVIQTDSVELAEEHLSADPEVRAVLLDFSVAELLGGIAVVARLRAQGRGRMPVIVHSAMQAEELRVRARTMRADSYHRKGGLLLDLVEALRTLCHT